MRRTLIINAVLPTIDNYMNFIPPFSSENEVEKLQNSLLKDTISKASVVPDTDLLVSCNPDDTGIRFMLPENALFAGKDEDGLNNTSSCISRLCETERSMVLMRTDTPTLPARCIELAFDALADRKVDIVIGPASNGGCYLAGVNSIHGDLLNKIDFNGPLCTDKCIEIAAENNLGWYLLPEWHRIRTSTDLAFLKNELLDRWVKNPPAEYTRELLKTLVASGVL